MRTLVAFFLLLTASAVAQAPVPPSATRSSDFWRPIQPGEVTLFGALENLGQSLKQDRLLSSRGVYRSLNFQYKALRYEKDFFHVYRGVNLKSFWEGRFDLGLFSHRPTRGVIFGPGGNYRPARSNRYELRFRWNLGDR